MESATELYQTLMRQLTPVNQQRLRVLLMMAGERVELAQRDRRGTAAVRTERGDRVVVHSQ